jgi:hypothetical protein
VASPGPQIITPDGSKAAAWLIGTHRKYLHRTGAFQVVIKDK